MSDIAISFASLVKSNNGMFKSDKQAEFLLSHCENGEFITCGNMYGHSFNLTYVCDAQGVTRVIHYTSNTGDKTTWERVEAGKVSVQERKEFKRIMREIKRIEKSIAERDSALDNGQYATHMELYESSNTNDQEMLAAYRAKL